MHISHIFSAYPNPSHNNVLKKLGLLRWRLALSGLIHAFHVIVNKDGKFILFFFIIHCYLETLQHLAHIASTVFG